MGSQQPEGSGLDYRDDQDTQKDKTLHSPCPLNVTDGVWDGALSPRPEFSARHRQRGRWKGTESP